MELSQTERLIPQHSLRHKNQQGQEETSLPVYKNSLKGQMLHKGRHGIVGK